MIELISAQIFLGKSLTLDRPHILLRVQTKYGKSFHHDADRIAVLAQMLKPSLAQELAEPDPHAALARITLALQQRAGYSVEKFAVHPDRDSYVNIAIELEWVPAAENATKIGMVFFQYLQGASNHSFRDLMHMVIQYEALCADGPQVDHRYIANEARKRGIPARYSERAVLPLGHVLTLGHGKYQRKMFKNFTDQTSYFAVINSTDKTSTIKALRTACLPVPEHIPVQTSKEAVKAAQSIGFPVVVKPVLTDRGVGITAGITSLPAVQPAFELARKFCQQVAVEVFIPGDTYRLLVVGYKFVAASRTEPTVIFGDGKRTVRELIDATNMDPRRGPRHLRSLTWLDIDDEAVASLKDQNLTLDSVVTPLHVVRLRTTSNLSRGGISLAVTEQVHEENRKLAERCARIMGLDLAGIDFRTNAIDVPWQQSGGRVIEVNPSPGLRLHFAPHSGKPVDVASHVLGLFYSDRATSRIPTIAVTGTNGKTTVTRLLAHIFAQHGFLTGRATTEEIAIGDVIVKEGDCAGPGGARTLLSNPVVEAAVLETARGAIIRYGLGFDSVDVAVVLNVDQDHLGELGVSTLDDLARVKRIVADSADRAIVVNADDPRCLDMASGRLASKVVLFSLDDEKPAVKSHVEFGGIAFCLCRNDGGETVVRLSPNARDEFGDVKSFPLTREGKARHNVYNLLAALAAADAIGLSADRSREAARAFMPDAVHNVGRLNLIDGFPFQVLVDYAHNQHGFAAISDYVRQVAPTGQRICALTMNGARITDELAYRAVQPLASDFDVFVPYDHDVESKRREGLSSALMAGLVAAGVEAARIHPCSSTKAAVKLALNLARPRDFVLVLCGGNPKGIIAHIKDQCNPSALIEQ